MGPVASADATLRVGGALLQAVAFAAMLLLLWRLLMPTPARDELLRVDADGRLSTSLAATLQSAPDTLDVRMDGAPDARARAELRAVRGSGRTLRLATDVPLAPLAASAEAEWRLGGGTRVALLGADSVSAVVSDAAGAIDSTSLTAQGVHTRSGPVQGPLRVKTAAAGASVAPLGAGRPAIARVLVLGDATWESRFLLAALEEAGWPVDAGLSVSPTVQVTQGVAAAPSRSRHSIVVVLPGASASALAALPAFVRGGGGLVIVGAAARSRSLADLRAGAPGNTMGGEVGAEASPDARRGLDLVPVNTLANGGVPLESRQGRIAIAARRVGAGRVVQVGYENSWLWRMAGNDDAPVAHRRWWTSILSGVVPRTAPVAAFTLDPAHDTLDAAPIAALARDLGQPVVRTMRADTDVRSLAEFVDTRWLLAFTVLSLVASWTLRRWRGLA